MTDQEQIQLLWSWGRFRAPSIEGFPMGEAHNVMPADLATLTFKDEEVRQALARYQHDGAVIIDQFTLAEHKRLCIPDGDKGKSTDLFLESPRCYMPDYEVSITDDPDVGKLWNRPAADTGQEGNWPPNCRMELTFGRNFDKLPGLTEADTDGVYHAIANNWSVAFEDVNIEPVPDRTPPAGVRGWHHLESMSGSTLAWNQLAISRCDVNLKGAWNSRVNWGGGTFQLPSATGTHEAGHWLGLNHQNDQAATMYFAITSASRSRHGYPNATDIRAMQRLGYDPFDDWAGRKPPLDRLFKPRDSGPDDPPPDDPSPGDGWNAEGMVTSIFTLRDNDGNPLRDSRGEIIRIQGIRSV